MCLLFRQADDKIHRIDDQIIFRVDDINLCDSKIFKLDQRMDQIGEGFDVIDKNLEILNAKFAEATEMKDSLEKEYLDLEEKR